MTMTVKLVYTIKVNVSNSDHMPGGLATWQELQGREGREGHLKRTKHKNVT